MNQHPDRPVQKGSQNGGRDANRRLSRRKSDNRHGHVYTDSPDTTIRAVTPDSAGSQFEITALPSPSFFPQSTSSRFQTQDPSTSVSNTDEEETIEGRRRKVKKKRHRDKTQPETSPNSFFDKTRKRLNSITTSSSHTGVRQEDPSLSIGFPSVVQASVFPDLQDIRQQLPRTPRRTASSDTGPFGPGGPLHSPVSVESDAEKILKLMKTTTGRMHGILFYRPIGTSAWHSSYCAINVAPGSLVCQTKGDPRQAEILIPDLRGCTVRTHYDPTDQTAYLSVVLPVSGLGYQLRPPVPETFDSWLAALLCWQPLKPKGVHNKLAKPQSISMTDRSSINNRRMSDVSSSRSTAVVKSSQMLLWDGVLPSSSYQRHQPKPRPGQQDPSPWHRVNCNLHENGTVRLLDEETASPLRTLKLGTLQRCAIQRLDSSVLGALYCIAIYPQYTSGSSKAATANPLVLSLNSRVAFEAWFVLLQAMTVPDLYGPEAALQSSSHKDGRSSAQRMFRIERLLHVRVIEARFPEYVRGASEDSPHVRLAQKHWDRKDAKIYVDIMLGRDLRARTVQKPFSNSIFWADEFSLPDIPSILSRVSVVLKVGNPDEKEWTMTTKGEHEAQDLGEAPNFEAIEIISHDPLLGKVDVPLHDLEQDKFVERWWPLYDANGSDVGQALIKLSLEESVVLMDSEYSELAALLHNFDNSLTPQLGHILGTELKSLSDVLLDIFQASGRVEDWINNLVEEEIDGIYREQPPIRMRFSGRIHSNDSYETAKQREMLVRDLSRSATMEANLLFRGNSLVTKALDAHMRRLGKDYLERTLGEKLRSIVANDLNCEVDPVKVKSAEQLERNWANLIGLTTSIWQAIAFSAQNCPPGMRNILKHIRSCAEDRYGAFIKTVRFTSVSGFLFLRFFCPAILNPKLFGLLPDHPPDRPRRTLTLIAKSLISLGNMAKFGSKETWMEPMNKFVSAATPEFKTFIEQICSWTASQDTLHEPQYQAALQVKSRLPPLTREGLLSLPFLVDSAKSYAVLVDTWVDAVPKQITDPNADECLKTFHRLCHEIHQRTKDCMAEAEAAREPDLQLDEKKWQRMLHQQRGPAYRHDSFEELSADQEITALPQPTSGRYSSKRIYSIGAVTAASPIREQQYDSPRDVYHKPITSSTNSSSVSFDQPDEYRSRHGVRSGDGSSRNTFLDISGNRRVKTDGMMSDDNRV